MTDLSVENIDSAIKAAGPIVGAFLNDSIIEKAVAVYESYSIGIEERPAAPNMLSQHLEMEFARYYQVPEKDDFAEDCTPVEQAAQTLGSLAMSGHFRTELQSFAAALLEK